MGGALEYSVGELSGSFAGFSGQADIETRAGNRSDLPEIAPPTQTNSIMPDPAPPNGFRPNDAENNMLEHLHRELQEAYPLGPDGTSPASGRVTLFSEQTPCDSCLPTIKAFQRMYPNLEIDVLFVTPYPPVRKDRPTLQTREERQGQ
ncbi:putative deaminase of polymorphic toxin system [Nocardia mexicana]|uniref:Putative deaminase of polymorphic toxin system n=2 Tax=Nocardia mexicana TaxID=279262 RepID=A0A370H6Y9_9NOCA|nr:putative deaminase of polymorphic toxin system [Nocardia mexicana]